MAVVVVATIVGTASLVVLVAPRWVLPGADGWSRRQAPRRPGAHRLVAAGAVGLMAAVVTGWPVAAVLAAAAALGLPALWADTAAQRSIDHLQAIACWTEMLRDTLHASVGLAQAIAATAPVSPRPIRGAVRLLSERLSAGVPMEQALRALADDLADPTADGVVCALLLAASARAQRLGELLTALASATRDQVAMQLRVEAARTTARSSVRIVVVTTVGFVTALTVLAHSYLAPFGTAEGQLVLIVVGGCDAAGLWLLTRMTRPRPTARLLVPDTSTRSTVVR